MKTLRRRKRTSRFSEDAQNDPEIVCGDSNEVKKESPSVEEDQSSTETMSNEFEVAAAILEQENEDSGQNAPSLGELLSRSVNNYHPEHYSSPPLMRKPDFRFPIINPEKAQGKLFVLYQLIITVPDSLKKFPPYTSETVCCQLCGIDLMGSAMFAHLITIQHLKL